MEFLRFLESIRTPFFNWFFSLITEIGGETVLLVLGFAFFWCIDKKQGYFTLLCGLFGTVLNQGLKLMCRVPRPWVLDESFTIVESAREAATGYSFPSGHTQNVAGTFGSLAVGQRKHRWVVISSIVIVVLVAFSRMYLGVHTPADVLTSLALALGLILLLRPVFASDENFRRYMPYIVVIGSALSLALLLYVFLLPAEGVDAANLASARKNACTLFGAVLGLISVFFLERLVGDFDTRAVWYVQVIKMVGGFAIVLLIKELLRVPLNFICFGNEYVGRTLRYFLMVVFAGSIWPMTFKHLVKLRVAALDNLFKRGSTGEK
jgi:undecaprenyl-diphosphatase